MCRQSILLANGVAGAMRLYERENVILAIGTVVYTVKHYLFCLAKKKLRFVTKGNCFVVKNV